MPDLTGFPALDLAIGLSFIFFLLALLASAIQEFIASLLALRSKMLEKGLRSMLADATPQLNTKVQESKETTPAAATPSPASAPSGNAAAPLTGDALIADFFEHPAIRALYRESRWPLGRSKQVKPRTGPETTARVRLPSYISPRSFALALVDTLAPDAVSAGASSQDIIAKIKTEVDLLALPAGVKHQLLALLSAARGDIDRFRTGLEAWFDDTMARVSGWYKRQTQLILLVLAIILVPLVNANSLVIGQALWKDTTLRAAVVAQATAAVATPTATPSPSTDPTQAAKDAAKKLDAAASGVNAARKIGIPMGWSGNDARPHWDSLGGVATALGGWLLTIIAISLGAPFWFDTLSRLSRLRSSGKPETPLPATGRGLANERISQT